MKTKENIKNTVKNNTSNIFYKSNPSGISLIVLVITIIVIIILATAIIVTLLGNNPIVEANKARFESDRDNMQSIFTNTVAKVMAQKNCTMQIKASSLNTATSGVSSSTGDANYILDDGNNTSGKIVFDNKENKENEYYTGKQLPIYKSGKTIWYVDEDGIISLKVGDKTYGEGKIVEEGINKDILISETILPSSDLKKATIEIQVKYSGIIDKVTIDKDIIDISKNEEGIYVGKVEVSNNGTYEIIANAEDGSYNKKLIKVTQINVESLTASIKAGIVTNGGVLLSVTSNIRGAFIEKIQIYEGQNCIKEILYDENKNSIVEEYKIEYLPFYVEKEYFAKIITNHGINIYETNKIKVLNSDSIKTKEDINNLSNIVNNEEDFYGKTIKVINDIDCENMSLRTIGSEVEFNGTFEGNYKIIKNISISSYKNVTAFFGSIGEKGTLRNIVFDGLKCSRVGNSDMCIGGVAFSNSGNIINVGILSGFISGGGNQEHSVGSICSYNYNNVENCFNKSSVFSNGQYSNAIAGGIVGNNFGVISNCYNRGTVVATSNTGLKAYAGGIAGYLNRPNCPVYYSYNTAKITAKGYTNTKVGECWGGGLFGWISSNNGGGISATINLFTGPESDVSFWKWRTTGNAQGYYNGVVDKVTDIKTQEVLDELGDGFTIDTDNRNDGYPILKWEKNVLGFVK